MLLHLLDTPLELPQTMAFTLGREPLREFRQALQGVVERADSSVFSSLWKRHGAAFSHALASTRYRVEGSAIREAYGLALSAPPVGLGSQSWLECVPEAWFAVASLLPKVAWLSSLGTPTPEQAALLRLERAALASSLPELLSDAHEGVVTDEPGKSVAWVRELRFQRHDDAPPQERIVDPLNDVVVTSGKTPLDPSVQSPVDALRLVRRQAGPGPVLEALVGAFALSRGPGPFLPAPPMSQSMQLQTWRVLPLFAVTHPQRPLLDAQVLEADSLRAAREWAQAAEPTRAWHEDFDAEAPPPERWASLVAEHWPRCRARFLSVLDEAIATDAAVIMLANDGSQPLWVGELHAARFTTAS